MTNISITTINLVLVLQEHVAFGIKFLKRY
jgi:hypothetical protein